MMTRILLAVLLILAAAPGRTQQIQFNRDIRPILSDNCFACHGPDANKRQANLRLDDPGAARLRAVLSAGKPEQSILLRRINAKEPALLMPPVSSHKKLTQEQRSLIARWIKQGAKYQAHWSYIPPRRPAVPTIQNPKLVLSAAEGSRIRNPIDAFVLDRLAEKGIRPSAEADRRTLIRRVYLDVIGTPPTPKEVAEFLADRSPGAYEKVVDRLLTSPRYGERMAAPWLDVVRYADTVGYHGDQNHNAWAYRDYVIKSFNENKPFDRFTLEQIAGDLLPNPTPEMFTATCFNRLNMTTREGGAQPKEYLAKYAADRVRTVSMAWLGSTMGCAECHDHKYDPFTQRDFYSMAAFFADIKQWGVYQDYEYTPNPDLKGWSNDHPFPPEIKVESAYLRQRIARNRSQIRSIAAASAPRADKAAAFEDWRRIAVGFLDANPGGWRAPAAAEVLSVEGKPAADKPYGGPLTDGSLLVNDGSPGEIGMSFTPGEGWLASFKLELLPNSVHNGSVLRRGSGVVLRVGVTLQRADGKSHPLAIRHASANYFEPRYYNGFDILGVQSAWQLSRQHLKEPNVSVWTLETPLKLGVGDKLFFAFKGARVGNVRVACSPFAPDDPNALTVAGPELEKALRDPAVKGSEAAFEAYLRGTAHDPQTFATLKKLERDILECRNGVTPVMVVEAWKPAVTRILPRGNWQDETGPVVQPAVPHFLPQPPAPGGKALTRLDLAKWLTSPQNPLTARMFVNRLWKQFFGAGLSDKIEDLGMQGESPSHPELLDWLAVEFMSPTRRTLIHQGSDPGGERSGTLINQGSKAGAGSAQAWDVKHIVRLIVTSATYRQSSKPRSDLANVDPGNRLLASQIPRRLDAEFVRDNALAVAGLINFDMGGPPCTPYQPAGYYANLQFPDREYQPNDDDRQWRRGVYMHWQRTFLHPMLANFDAPSREDCVAVRTAANTPQQALTLLNDPEFVEASRAFAARILAAPGTDADRLGRAIETALSRPIKPNEQRSLLAFLARVRKEYAALPEDAKKLLTVGIAPQPQGDPVELAAWTSVCRVILNLHETITRY